jgi:cyclic pyranopterin phosphate synthase
MCLGQEDFADLRTPLRRSEGDELLVAAIRAAGHDFMIDRSISKPALPRRMSVTGG